MKNNENNENNDTLDSLQLSIAPYSDLDMVYVVNQKEIRMVKNKN